MQTLERFLGSWLLEVTACVAKLDELVKVKEADEEGWEELMTGAVAWTLVCGRAGIVDVSNELANVVGIPVGLGVALDGATCLRPWILVLATALPFPDGIGAGGVRTTVTSSLVCASGGGVREPSEELEASDVEIESRDRFLTFCVLMTMCWPLAEWERDVSWADGSPVVKERLTPLLGEVVCSCSSCCWIY